MQKTIYNYIAAVMLLLSLGMAAMAQQPLSGAGRIWQGSFPPITPSTSFSKNRDVWQDTVSVQTYVYTGTSWRLSPTQIKGAKGDKGDKGDAGANGTNGRDGVDGICPSCPPSGSGNVGGVRWVTTWTEFTNAIANSTTRSIHLAADLAATSKVRIPASYNRIVEIDGHGYRITVPSSIDTLIVRSYASLGDANAGIDFQLRLRNIDFNGSNNVCVAVQAMYGATVQECRFSNFNVAFMGEWNMATVIDHCFFWENYIGVNLDYARFTGGSNSASQCNHSSITNCKFRNSTGDFANIRVYAASGIVIAHNIFEGQQAGGDYDVMFDDNSSNVVKEVNIYGNHVEHQPRIAAFYIRLKDGNAYCGGIYSQYDCTLIKFESSAYAKLIVENIPYLTSGTKFENVNGAGRWKFINMPATFLISESTRWVGTIPTYLAIDGWDTNGQKNYIQGTTVK